MILKTCFLLLVSVAWDVSGASYSNVFVQNGREAAPAVEYLQYGAPSYSYDYTNPQLSQYKAVPFGYEYPFGQSYSYRTAYPEQAIATLPAAPNPNIITYSAPVANTPYAYRHEPTSAYSYVLVNPGAGQDLKLSDGEVIRGGYTFQPEGLVQYVAEDNQGLNAIVQNYIPNEAIAHTETIHQETVHQSVHHAEPCHEAKSEALTAHESQEEEQEEQHGGHSHHDSEEHEEEHAHQKSHEAQHESHEAVHESHEAHHDSHEARHGSHEEIQESHEAHHDSHEARHGSHEEAEVHEIVLHTHSGSHESGGHNHIIVIEEKEESEAEPEEHHESEHTGHAHHESGHESHTHHEEKDEETKHESHESHEGHESHESHEGHESHESHEGHETSHTHEAIIEASHESHENHGHEGHVLVPQAPALVGNNVYISYNDFIKCIKAAIAKSNVHPYYTPVAKPISSPLTYLVFNKPC